MAKTLSGADREFFGLVHQAAFANPFSRERNDLDYKIAGIDRKLGQAELLAAVVESTQAKMRTLGRFSLSDYSGGDHHYLRSAVWFDTFHLFAGRFDDFIIKQQEAGDQPIVVPFADDIMGHLGSYGIAEKEAARVVSIFYQLRRAYFFLEFTLIGRSPSMATLRRHLWNNVFTLKPDWYEQYLWSRMEDFSTLLLGPTGAGKGAAAAAIGRSGYIPFAPRKKQFTESFTRAFVPINLAEYPETLIESELFGHKKGAFTGAVEQHVGAFGRCSEHGAIFLDELGDVDMPTQVKLLRVLQERVFTPVGSHEKQRFAGRIIAATNKDIHKARSEGTFRDDLYYRLCSDTIEIPTLYQRLQENQNELELLVGHLMHRLVGREAADLAEEIVAMIQEQIPKTYPWPGNVRELEQCIRRLLVAGQYAGDERQTSGTLVDDALKQKLSAAELLTQYCRALHARLGTYEEVAKITNLDRRTVKKYISPS